MIIRFTRIATPEAVRACTGSRRRTGQVPALYAYRYFQVCQLRTEGRGPADTF